MRIIILLPTPQIYSDFVAWTGKNIELEWHDCGYLDRVNEYNITMGRCDAKFNGNIFESAVIKVAGKYGEYCERLGLRRKYSFMEIVGHELAHYELFENNIMPPHDEETMNARGRELIDMFESGQPYKPQSEGVHLEFTCTFEGPV